MATLNLNRFASFGEAYVAHATDALTRAYTGATVADSVSRPAFVNDDLARLAATRPTLSMFKTGPLPKVGSKIEYPIFSVVGAPDEQTNDGDDIADVAVDVTSELAPVRTVGGKTDLSLQAARDALYLDRVKAVQMSAYAKRTNAIGVALLDSLVGVGAVTLLLANAGKASGWVNVARAAAESIEDNAAAAFEAYAWIVSRTEAAALLAVVDSDDVPVFAPQGSAYAKVNGVRPVGYVNGVPVIVDAAKTAGTSHIVAREGLTIRESSPFDLSNIDGKNLSSTLSLYGYLAIEPSDLGAIVRINHAA